MVNSEDPESVAFDLGLHCLLRTVCPKLKVNVVISLWDQTFVNELDFGTL